MIASALVLSIIPAAATTAAPVDSGVIPNTGTEGSTSTGTETGMGTMLPETNIPQDTGSRPGVIGTTSPTTTGGTSGNMDNSTSSKIIGVIIAVIAVIAVIILIVALVPKRRK